MKLLLCIKCGDVLKLDFKERACECGSVRGAYMTDGHHAWVSDNAVVLGMNNKSLVRAVNIAASDPHAGNYLLDVDAWVFGKGSVAAVNIEWRNDEG